MNRLVRKCNLQKLRFGDSLDSDIAPFRRALVNETGFQLFSSMVEGYIVLSKNLDSEIVKEVAQNALDFICELEIGGNISPLNEVEFFEAKSIADRTYNYFFHYDNIEVNPMFSGCGIVSDCYGDVLADSTLYEIKSGDRGFRITDLKQVLTYCVLNYSDHKVTIDNIALLNPRLGVYIVLPLIDVVELASGRSTIECFSEMIDFFDSPEDFR